MGRLSAVRKAAPAVVLTGAPWAASMGVPALFMGARGWLSPPAEEECR